MVGEVIGGASISGALDDLAAEALDLIGGHVAEIVVEGVPGFELLAINQEGVGPWQRIARGLVEVAEKSQAAVFQRGCSVLVLAVEAGDVVIDQL